LDASVTFVDSHLRAVALAEINALSNGLTNFQAIASSTMEGLQPAAYNVILANPPYYAISSIAKLFVERSRPLLKPGGRFYLVTKQVEHVAPFMVEAFGDVNAYDNRGYAILEAIVE
jgi:16S rRNA (guanine1207-N2)-methyltransferase